MRTRLVSRTWSAGYVSTEPVTRAKRKRSVRPPSSLSRSLNLNESIQGWKPNSLTLGLRWVFASGFHFGFSLQNWAARSPRMGFTRQAYNSRYVSPKSGVAGQKPNPTSTRKYGHRKYSYIVTLKCAHLVNCSIRFQCKLRNPQTWNHFQVLFEVLFPGESLCSNGLACVFAVPCLLAFCCSWLLPRSPPPCGRRKRP